MIGELNVALTQAQIDSQESELGDQIKFTYSYEGQECKFQGNYYIIILNKQAYLDANPPSKKKNVQFQDKKLNSPHKSTPPSKKSPKKKQDLDTQMLQEQIEKSVKGAMQEMKKSLKLDDKTFQINKDTLARARTIENMEDSPTRISESV